MRNLMAFNELSINILLNTNAQFNASFKQHRIESHFNAVLFCEVILALCNNCIVSVDF